MNRGRRVACGRGGLLWDLQHAVQQTTRHFASNFFPEHCSHEADGGNGLLGGATEMAVVGSLCGGSGGSAGTGGVDVGGRGRCCCSCSCERSGTTICSGRSSGGGGGGGSSSFFFVGCCVAVLGTDVHELLYVNHVARACIRAGSHLRRGGGRGE